MRRILPLLLCIACPFYALAQKDCRHFEYEEIISSTHPGLTKKYQAIEQFTKVVSSNQISRITDTHGGGIPAIITIPVVVHVLFNNAQQNISESQIRSQIDALTNDYRKKNADINKVPAYYAAMSADCGIEFRLANIDPSGVATSGIVRKQTNIQVFGLDDRIKTSAIGGDNAWDRNKYLNIWVGNLAGGILGYSSTPGGPAEKDGIVVSYMTFGTVGSLTQRFDLGRTATHEIGHWLNLRHIWGDTYCGDDNVDDTPKQRSPNRGCPGGQKITCEPTGHGDMYMNFMDLTDDGCMFMFTPGQRQRIRALFEIGGPRNEMLSSNGVSGISTGEPAEIPVESAASSQQLLVYPNPASSIITIEMKGTENSINNSVIIYNSFGQPLATEFMKSNKVSINIAHLKAGVYFIRQNGKPRMTKFVKN